MKNQMFVMTLRYSKLPIEILKEEEAGEGRKEGRKGWEKEKEKETGRGIPLLESGFSESWNERKVH